MVKSVINEADESLLAFFADAEFGYKGPQFSFDVPTTEWRGKLGAGPTVNLFLHHVVEMVESRLGAPREVRSHEGRVTERRPPIRRYELAYLVSAWAANVEEEHRLLGDVLRYLADWETLPARYRKGTLAAAELPIPMFVGTPVTGVVANRWDIWGTLGGDPKTSFDLILSVPLIPRPDTDIGPPTEVRRFDFSQAGGEKESVASAHRDEEAGVRNSAFHAAEAARAAEAGEAGAPAPTPRVRGRVVREGMAGPRDG